ncbi:DUF817 domain-containing protein [Streptomyces sp. NPDC048340]|uniref:DUF817 domain-containing protein n=1 Tax=Streptomyces sp. NPDC048340 TaxID=3365537 RepID=UPI0037235EC3
MPAATAAAIAARLAHAIRQLVRFGLRQAANCAFAVALLAGVGLSGVLPELPVARYDLLFGYGVLLSLCFYLIGWERGRDLAVIAGCHLLGLVFEYVKVALGSWSYPEPALLKFGGVPLYGGFLYAAVGSYICAVWRLLRIDLSGYRPAATAAVAGALYVNFISHHWLPDLRWPLAALLVVATASARVHYTVGKHAYWMPMPVSFVLIGFFLWVAENIATYAGAWRYPYQLDGWQPVSMQKFGAWALLVSVLCVLGAAAQHRDRPRADRTS